MEELPLNCLFKVQRSFCYAEHLEQLLGTSLLVSVIWSLPMLRAMLIRTVLQEGQLW